jgi:hypothetical protein
MPARRASERGGSWFRIETFVWILVGILVFVVAILGSLLVMVPDPGMGARAIPVGLVALGFATTVMFKTAERWAGFVPGFIFLPAILGSLGRLPLHLAGFMAAYCLLLILLLWRFIPPRRRVVSLLDRTALTLFALSAAAFAALEGARQETAIPAIDIPLIGACPLVVAWAVSRWGRPGHDPAR